MGWYDNALTWIRRAPLEVTIKNTVGQITKEFYGYGPRAASRCLVAGRLILYVTPVSGSLVLEELAARPTGRVLIDYNNRLLVNRYREPLARLAGHALNADLLSLFVDFDEASRQMIGCALFGDFLGGQASEPVAAGRRLAWLRTVVGERFGLDGWRFHGGARVLWGAGPSVLGAGKGAGDSPGEWAHLEEGRAWRETREALAAQLRDGWRFECRQEPVVFLGDDGRACVVGLILDNPDLVG